MHGPNLARGMLAALLVASLSVTAAEEETEAPAVPPDPAIGSEDQSIGPIPGDQADERSDQAPLLTTFEERRRAVLQAFAAKGSDRFTKAQVLFALGRTQEALVEVNRGLYALEPGNTVNRWLCGGNTGFIAWPGIDCYIRHEHQLDAATKERYRRVYTTGVFYAKLSTSNHKVMAALTRYLATQVWGADAFHADPFYTTKHPYYMAQVAKQRPGAPMWGTRFCAGDDTGEKYLTTLLTNTVRYGPGEFASRPYGAQNILPLLTLADCAKDPQMARRARIAYEVCLIQMAPAWLRGHLATFAPRSYPDIECQQPWGVATIPWLYFGGVTPKLTTAKAAADAAVNDYRIPAPIVTAATDRSAPYSYRAVINGWALNHYVNRTYALFSRSAKRGSKVWQGQSYPCGVMWEQDPAKSSHLWVTNPSSDEPGDMGNHTHGVRASEQNLLTRDSLLYVFQIDDEAEFPYALGYVPGGHLALINDSASTGRIFLHYGSVLIAVAASEPFTWNPAGGIHAPAAKPRPGDSEFRVRSMRCAVAIETAPPEEFPGQDPAAQLAAFRARILETTAIACTGKKATATYTNRHGDRMECAYRGPDLLQGVPVDYQAWPISESPWTRQRTIDDPLVVSDGKTERTYDFTRWTITERTLGNATTPNPATP